jgi:thiamine pyrophosphate-dependent acetolactate synthase large subunit-like protein
MQRLDLVKALGGLITPDDLVVSSIGELWDDWWNHRPDGAYNTYSPVILGSISSTALGLALALPHRRILSLDTDGSVLMNTGIMCTLGNQRPSNLTVVVVDNEIYECIGGPPTLTAGNTDLAKMAEGAGCINCGTVDDVESLIAEAGRLLTDDEFGFLVAKVEPGTQSYERGERRTTDGVEDKYRFIRYVEALEGIVVHPGTDQN